MTFAEVLAHESAYPGKLYRRIDYDAKWVIRFDPENAGRLIQGPAIHSPSGEIIGLEERPVEIYHPDLLPDPFGADWSIV